MGGLFSAQSPKPLTPPPPPPPLPTVDEATNASEAQDKLRRRKGRASTILTQDTGALSAPTTAATLLGS